MTYAWLVIIIATLNCTNTKNRCKYRKIYRNHKTFEYIFYAFHVFFLYLVQIQGLSIEKVGHKSIIHPHFFSLRSVLSLTSITFSDFQNFNYLIMRLFYLSLGVIDWRNVYNIHHAIPHDLGLSLTFFCWSLCRRYRIRLRIKQTPCRWDESGHHTFWFISQDEIKCFSAWNKQFHGMKVRIFYKWLRMR